ncbi:alpha-amylase family protein [Kineosporia sp. R_H_3]|uniref:alpha-amylase family protein n=1 Tax=Kineosporia sp. R_H_3 TaxID=1961848 RepID=UPI000B4B11C9
MAADPDPKEGAVASTLEEVLRQAREALADLPAERADDVALRLERWGPDLLQGLAVYGDDAPLAEVVRLVTAAARTRRPALAALDKRRLLRPDWFGAPDQVGYVCYADRFAGTLRGVGEKLGYLRELGVTYLHLMPLLEPREGPDDGGYAVRDYRTVRPDLGTLADLGRLADSLHAHGMTLTLDLVLNHVAREHDWAQAALRGEEPYRSYFLMYPDRTAPDAYERTLPEVFPDFAPGSFTWVPEAVRPAAWGPGPDAGSTGDAGRGAWVWTTFNDFQWDLDWSNPAVFCELLSVILDLANVGVDVFRLDAIAFLWKRLGTTCQGEPEVHQVVQALRAATRVAAPAVIFKAEAIVAPEDLPAYLGTGRHAGKVCDLAYHNSLMVQLWSAVATGRADLARRALAVPPPKPVTTSWGTYVRCHDDIGWAISDTDAGALGLSGYAHRRFLAEFFTGAFPGSFARGEQFQANPATGDARISGTLASLAGLEAALETAAATGRTDDVDLALGRIFLLHAVAYGYGGIPLLYMGDELGLRNDRSYLDDPRLAADNRWLHRPWMDWTAAERRHDPATVEGRVFAGLRHLARVRAGLPALHAAVESEPVDLGNGAVLALRRRHPAGAFLGLYNVSPAWQRVSGVDVARLGVPRPWENLSSFAPRLEDGELALPPYAAWWLTRSPG